MREVFGEYRAPTGVARRDAVGTPGSARSSSSSSRWRVVRPSSSSPSPVSTATRTAPSRSPSPPATPAWRSSTPASGSTPEQIAASARDEDPDVIGLSILSGSHLDLVPDVLGHLEEMGVDAPVVVGGIIPEDDRATTRGDSASPRSTRRRTSSSPRSCATSPISPSPTAPADPLERLDSAGARRR